MPIDGTSSYPATIASFLAHWDQVNTALGANGPLIVPGGLDKQQLSDWRDDLVNFASSIQDKINDREIARGTIEINRQSLIDRVGEFNRKVRGFLGNTPYVRALPDIPTITSGEPKILLPLDDMASLWGKINSATIPGFTPPLILLNGYVLATFITELTALKAAYLSYKNAEQSLKLEREQRNDVEALSYAAMRDYRAAVLGTFSPDDALVASMPALSPSSGGSGDPEPNVPDAVTISGSWDAMTSEAAFDWEESTDPQLQRYDLRYTPGTTYDANSEVQAGSVLAGTTEIRTTQGLAAPGSVATFRVYVVTASGDEAGSNVVTISRP